MIGTDYPFDMGDYDVYALVYAIPGLTDREREQMLGANAMRLLSSKKK